MKEQKLPAGFKLEDGKYVIEKHLGNGSFGNVYLVDNKAIDNMQALKLLSFDGVDDFREKLQEAVLLSKVRGAHVVEIYDAGIIKYSHNEIKHRMLGISMEYLKNGSVEGILGSSFISVKKATEYLSQTLFGLGDIHCKSIIHKDIKPGNLMISDTNAIKVSDFGLAFFADNNDNISTKAYCLHASPEMVKQEKPSILSDIYALGVTYYRLLNQILSFPPEILSNPQLWEFIIKGKFPCRKSYSYHIPRKIINISNKGMNPLFSKRYQNVFEFQGAISKLRFNIDWIPNGSIDNWIGNDDSRNYIISILSRPRKSKFEVIWKMNNRKDSSICKEFNNINEARHYMFEKIRETTLM